MKTCYIFSAAQGLPQSFCRNRDDIVIAADAGYRHLEKMGITPDVVLGDFDSLKFIPENTEIIKHPVKKDDTDTILAVKTGLERGFKRFVLYGCVGGRFDHTLANLQTLNFIACNGGIGFIYSDDFCITSIKDSSICFSEQAVGNVSVFSADTKACGVTIKGLLYELENAELSSHFPLGVSNEFIGEKSFISVEKGVLNIVFDSKINFSNIKNTIIL